MLPGSNEAFTTEAEKERGSYYLAKAYVQECDNLVGEHEAMAEEYGEERAVRMMKLIFKHAVAPPGHKLTRRGFRPELFAATAADRAPEESPASAKAHPDEQPA